MDDHRWFEEHRGARFRLRRPEPNETGDFRCDLILALPNGRKNWVRTPMPDAMMAWARIRGCNLDTLFEACEAIGYIPSEENVIGIRRMRA